MIGDLFKDLVQISVSSVGGFSRPADGSLSNMEATGSVGRPAQLIQISVSRFWSRPA
jgi:hypothetical protein